MDSLTLVFNETTTPLDGSENNRSHILLERPYNYDQGQILMSGQRKNTLQQLCLKFYFTEFHCLVKPCPPIHFSLLSKCRLSSLCQSNSVVYHIHWNHCYKRPCHINQWTIQSINQPITQPVLSNDRTTQFMKSLQIRGVQ